MSKSFRPVISSNNSRPPGRRTSWRRTGRPPRRCTGSRTGRSKRPRQRWPPDASRRSTICSSRWPAGSGRGAGQRLAAGRRHRGNAGNPHYLPTSAQSQPADRAGRGAAARPVGQESTSRARSLLTSPGLATTARRVPARRPRAFQAIVDATGRGGSAGRRRGRRRPRSARLGGRSGGARRCSRPRATGPYPAPYRPQPRRKRPW